MLTQIDKHGCTDFSGMNGCPQIGLLKNALRKAGLPLYLAPYGVLPTAYECGIIEVQSLDASCVCPARFVFVFVLCDSSWSARYARGKPHLRGAPARLCMQYHLCNVSSATLKHCCYLQAEQALTVSALLLTCCSSPLKRFCDMRGTSNPRKLDAMLCRLCQTATPGRGLERQQTAACTRSSAASLARPGRRALRSPAATLLSLRPGERLPYAKQ